MDWGYFVSSKKYNYRQKSVFLQLVKIGNNSR